MEFMEIKEIRLRVVRWNLGQLERSIQAHGVDQLDRVTHGMGESGIGIHTHLRPRSPNKNAYGISGPYQRTSQRQDLFHKYGPMAVCHLKPNPAGPFRQYSNPATIKGGCNKKIVSMRSKDTSHDLLVAGRTHGEAACAVRPQHRIELPKRKGEIDRIEVLETSNLAEFLVSEFRHVPALAVWTPNACFADYFPPAAILTGEALQIVIIFIMAPGLALVPEQPLQWYGAIWAFSQVSEFVRVSGGITIIPDGHFSNLPNTDGRSLCPCPDRATVAPG
jgi:hypothetical protein